MDIYCVMELELEVFIAVLRSPTVYSLPQNCIGHVRADGQPCPCCRGTDFITVLDKKTRGKILGLRVQCSKDGCVWEGELGKLERHIASM